jgi:hypothetical protein
VSVAEAGPQKVRVFIPSISWSPQAGAAVVGEVALDVVVVSLALLSFPPPHPPAATTATSTTA